MRVRLIPAAAVAAAVALAGCGGKGPAAMHYGEDRCDYCRMNIADPAFGTQLISGKGKVFRFDSIECLAAYELAHQADIDASARWLADVNDPGTFLAGAKAVVVAGERLRSPMGLGLAATASEEAGQRLAAESGGRTVTWEEVRAYVADAWDIK
ncbi:MAG TPA: nitrous oxide reductase accessory protein NosL [candidate division Zixibacteria bacterium]|nr:nitrous oxide reductase accessory protein NosL [candidate division Zixibacteria bacterium]MDD4917677.1 nitrous oxide reductase accessory protein NosL [candidate division Zixibacteria bacterium]MDM7974081.1 nitrous oxide reductase accessory protein NosL [candidate division Zixibacteria bacterium]HOD65568.1 nitrous oxide reductase accessory protein NosL [candidate division Zixibacteria bacterium]HOZ06678.1 nitrous oxide reductase accessory protein NosL [candidate division Zixibacteria bacteriu